MIFPAREGGLAAEWGNGRLASLGERMDQGRVARGVVADVEVFGRWGRLTALR